MPSTTRSTTQMQTTQAMKTTKSSSKCDKCVPPYYCNGKVDRTVQSPFDMTKYFSCKNGLASDCSTCPGKSVYVEVCGRCTTFDTRECISLPNKKKKKTLQKSMSQNISK